MSSGSRKHEWLVIIPDHDGTLEKRLSIRQQHLNGIKPIIDSGFLLMGGGFLEEPMEEGQTPKLKGSVILAEAESKEEVIKTLKEDIYSRHEVWNWDKVQIYPFVSALRKGKELQP